MEAVAQRGHLCDGLRPKRRSWPTRGASYTSTVGAPDSQATPYTDEASSASERARGLMETGADNAGAATGGALGLIGGPVGVAAGSFGGVVVARALRKIGADLSERLSGRQRDRVGATYSVLGADIALRLERGNAPRSDGFLDTSGYHRSGAESLLEGTLLAAANEYEERKVPFLGHFYANLIFSPVSAADASFLLTTVQRLTFRQVVLLAIFSNGTLRPELATMQEKLSDRRGRLRRIVAREINDLADAGLLTVDEGAVGGSTNLMPLLEQLRLTETGRTLSALLQLRDMSEVEIREVLRDFEP
jgi:hypothetical protein